MNSFDIVKLTNRFQDVITQSKKTFPALRTFKKEIQSEFVIFSKGDLEKIYEFIKAIRNNPKKISLAHALKPMFRMLVNTMIDQSAVVFLFHKKEIKNYFIQIHDIFPHFKRKTVNYNGGYKCFIIPFNHDDGRTPTYKPRKPFLHEEEAKKICDYDSGYIDVEYEYFIRGKFSPKEDEESFQRCFLREENQRRRRRGLLLKYLARRKNEDSEFNETSFLAEEGKAGDVSDDLPEDY